MGRCETEVRGMVVMTGGAVAEGREECGAEAKGLAGGAGRAGAGDRGARAVLGVVGQWG